MWLLKRVIYLAIILAAILIGYAVKKSLSKPLYLVWILLVVTFCSETTAVVLAFQGDNSFIYHLFNPVETCLWGVCYYHLFTGRFMKRATAVLCAIAMVMMIANTIWFQQMGKQPNNYSVVAESLFLLIISLFYFKEMLRYPQEESILRSPFFWLNSVVLLFYTINILFWTSYGLLKAYNKPLLRTGFQLLFYSNYLFYATIGVSFWLQRKNNNSSSHIP